NSSLFYDVVQDGGAGDDLLIGGDGDDRLTGNGGDDNLVGDTGDDLFVFNDGDGNDTIIDFTAGAGSDDVIDLRGDSFNNSLSELLTHASQEGADTEIDLGGGDAVTLVGVNMGDLHEDDFLFV
ncbi:MAG: calcium-binding protein, partial [Rhodospirillaceae bacterium]|nr:calcium-binding protein [Rhodospirillaceae bacterium]